MTHPGWITRTLIGWGALLLSGGAVGCGGPDRPTHLPPPVYESPELPPWEPEAAPDPLDSEFEGEWADEPPPAQEPPPAGEAPEPPAQAPADSAPEPPAESPAERPGAGDPGSPPRAE